ncbi:MAG: tetratricopeptide repeat protein [Planctomycetota bacterium]
MTLKFRAAAWAALFVALSGFAFADEVPPEARSQYDKAQIAREEGRHLRAAELFKKAIEAHPLYEAAHVGYQAALRGTGDPFAARDFYDDLVAKHASSVELKAFSAAVRDPAQAIDALKALATENSANIRVKLELGRAYLRAGDPKSAEKPLKAVLKLDANNVVARTMMGDALLARGKPKSARKEFDAALQLDNANVPARLRLALAWHAEEKSGKALAVLGKLVSEDAYPNLVAAHWLLAKIRLDMGKIPDAVKSIDKILAIDKGDFDALFAKGILLLRQDKPDEAVKVFTQATTKNPRSGDAMFALGWAYEQWADVAGTDDAKAKERLTAAADAYEKCTNLDPSVRPRDSLGFVYLLGNRSADSIKQFKRAADTDQKFAAAVNNLGLVSDMADNRAAAKKKYEEVLRKIDKKNVRALVMLALDHWLDGASSKAVKGLEKAVKINPEDDLAWAFLGDVHADRQKWASALKAYEQATKLNPRNFIAWYHMGQVYQDVKSKWEEADRCYRKAVEAKASPPHELFLRLAEVNEEEALDNKADALKFYKQYKEAGGSTDEPWDWIEDRIEDLEKELSGK